jgi:hypothetical protein
MISPKEKAEELVNKMERPMDGVSIFRLAAKKLALIAVDEVIESLHEHHWQNRLIINYWEEVKQEIENYG